jgi:hypothetical protein
MTGLSENWAISLQDCYALQYVSEPYWCKPFKDILDPEKLVTPSGLISYYRLNQKTSTGFSSSTNVYDAVSSNHGTHSIAVFANFVTGVVDEALDYSNDYTTIAATSELTFVDIPFSVSGWFKFDATGSSEVLLSKQDTNGDTDYEFRVEKNSLDEIVVILYTDASNYISIKSTSTLSASTWYHIVVAHDGTDNESGLNIYLDSVQETPQSNSSGTYTGMVDNSLPLHIGFKDDSVSNDYFNGVIDGLGIWSVELNQSNVDIIYEIQQTKELI